jgi:hypothetical protein
MTASNDNVIQLNPDEAEQLERQLTDAAETLWQYLKHGDDRHQAWLKRALYAFFRNQPIPKESGRE